MKFDYETRGIKLKSVQCVKELGVKIASNLKFSQQCIDAANKEDDTKIGISVLNDEDRQSLQEDLHKISACSDRWEMPFNVDSARSFKLEQ